MPWWFIVFVATCWLKKLELTIILGLYKKCQKWSQGALQGALHGNQN